MFKEQHAIDNLGNRQELPIRNQQTGTDEVASIGARPVKYKKDGTPKQSGGKRIGAGRGLKMSAAEQAEWKLHLERALKLAANNMFVLPREKFFTKREIKSRFGTACMEEFGTWFDSVRMFDQAKADAIRQKQHRGDYNTAPASWKHESLQFYTPEKYADWLIDHKCFSWMSILKREHHKSVWKKYSDNGK